MNKRYTKIKAFRKRQNTLRQMRSEECEESLRPLTFSSSAVVSKKNLSLNQLKVDTLRKQQTNLKKPLPKRTKTKLLY